MRLDWFESLDSGTAPLLRSLLREEINPDLIIGSDIVGHPTHRVTVVAPA